jgi:hypothetical protein
LPLCEVRQFFGFIGITDVNVVYAGPGNGDETREQSLTARLRFDGMVSDTSAAWNRYDIGSDFGRGGSSGSGMNS